VHEIRVMATGVLSLYGWPKPCPWRIRFAEPTSGSFSIHPGDGTSEALNVLAGPVVIDEGVTVKFNYQKNPAWQMTFAGKVDAVILTGFEYAGNKFKLSLENQINYKAECELRETLTYPHRVKTLDGYYDFQNAADYYAFYLAGIQFIRQTIEQGWTQKDALDLHSTEELIKSLKLKVES